MLIFHFQKRRPVRDVSKEFRSSMTGWAPHVARYYAVWIDRRGLRLSMQSSIRQHNFVLSYLSQPSDSIGRFARTRERVDGTIQHVLRREKLDMHFVSMMCCYSSLLSPSGTCTHHTYRKLLLYSYWSHPVWGCCLPCRLYSEPHARNTGGAPSGWRYEGRSTFF